MIKKICLILILVFSLSSCGEGDNPESSLVEYENDNFKMSVPSNWKELEDVEETLPKASVGDIEVVLVSENTISGFANNMIILSSDLNKTTSSEDYSMLNNLGAEKDYLEYLKISSREVSFTDSDKSIIYEFEAKYNFESPKLKFLQTAKVCHDTKAYLITIAIPITTSDISRYIDFVSSFVCK